MAQYLKEMDQDPFDPGEFVERIAWKTLHSSQSKEAEDGFDPDILHDSFVEAIRDLKGLHEVQEKKCGRLETICHEEEKKQWQKITELKAGNKLSYQMFQALDERINYVSAKVVHLGDQLESVNTPRARAVEALKLMNYFAEFLGTGPVLSEVFTDRSQLYEAADVIQKLNLIAQELPDEKFLDAKNKIGKKYDEIERSLLEEFVKAHRSEDRMKMKEITGVLSHFKGYSQCVNAFIEQSQLGAFSSKDIFAGVLSMCEKNHPIIIEVFSNPEQVMGKFVVHIYQKKIQKHIETELSKCKNSESYLKSLYDLYCSTVKLTNELSRYKMNMGSDIAFLSKQARSIFHTRLDTYINYETNSLREKSASNLQNYYEKKQHQKKPIQSVSFQDLRRDIQAVIGTRANINIAQIENYGGETFLSEEVAISLLQESKMAFKRCNMLSKPSDLPNHAIQIFDILVQYLIIEFIDYALELGLHAIPVPDAKTPPEIYFFNVVHQCNTVIHLLEKQFNDSLVPLVISTPKHGDCLHKKRILLENLEMKLDNGLDRTLQVIVLWVKLHLQTEQKKSDFKPENESSFVVATSDACLRVVKFVNKEVKKTKESLDGRNVEVILMELGIRFHRVIYDHILQFQYNSVGAMVVIFDVNEYRKCIQELKIPLVNNLFDTLHALCNLLVVRPQNLKQVCSGDQLSVLDRSILSNFIQLRFDYKTSKLSNIMKGLTP